MLITAHIYMAVEDDYQYLIEDLDSGLKAWENLRDHFQRSMISHRISTHREFYSIIHNPSKPITFYVKSLLDARKKLELLGCKIDDIEFKDVLLMHLDCYKCNKLIELR